jgi:hypothetical protein
VESCNGVDDDCDGMTDEGCGACAACAGATTVSGTGGRYAVALGPNAHTGTGTCSVATGSEAYLTFTLTATRDVFISTHDAGIDTVLYVRDCSCTGTQRACNDDAAGHNGSALNLRDLPAGTYNVFVDTKSSMSGSVDVDVYITNPGSSGDRCGDPLPIAAGATSVTGNTCGNTHDYDLVPVTGCTLAPAGDYLDQVYYFYVPTTRTVTINGCDSGMDYDSVIFIRSVCNDASSGAQITCNDDGGSAFGCGGGAMCNSGRFNSALSVTLSPGLYYLFTDGYGTSGVCSCGPYSYAITGL